MAQLSTQDVNSAIMFGNFSNDQLNSIVTAVKFRRVQIARETRRALVLGDTVRFTHPKTGRVHQGSVVKIAIKNVKVREGLTTWNVPANLLTADE